MTSMGLGAAKRHEISETVRMRMATVLPVAAEGVRGGAGGPSATGPPSWSPSGEPSAPPGESGGGVGGPDVPELVDPPVPGDGPRFRFGPAMMLDRRAVVGLAVLLLFAVGYAVQHFWLARPQAVAVPALAVASGPSAPASAGAGTEVGAEAGAPEPPPAVEPVVVVDVGGRVHVPGLHTLPGGSRVADALRVAGGPLPETDTRSLNLARVLTDGEQILVGEPGPPPASAAGAGSGAPVPAVPKQPVSLNRATLEQLDTLPGVGPTLAQRILAYRTSHGSFRTVDQLRQVSGIGARTYAELRPLLTL
ncbi:ComEA family DNA-binding protein [Kitasatospora aureofaciens]|uniref:ComEA family DNA-binding protein n=1 Tax=Kitasatospora aureofaciens TaxID=1894 RepID=UPI00210DE899|nr:ComEA family DNA-binding protein [Kitasatospora aureofaciens]